MRSFTDELPSEFTDEERYLKFFPKNVFLTALVLLAANFLLSKFMSFLFGPIIPFLIFFGLISVVIIALMLIPTNPANVMRGGGQDVMSVIIKRIYRSKNKCIYAKGIKH